MMTDERRELLVKILSFVAGSIGIVLAMVQTLSPEVETALAVAEAIIGYALLVFFQIAKPIVNAAKRAYASASRAAKS